MKTRNLLESEHPALPWLLIPIFFALVLTIGALAVAVPIAGGVLAVAIGVALMVAFFRMGRR